MIEAIHPPDPRVRLQALRKLRQEVGGRVLALQLEELGEVVARIRELLAGPERQREVTLDLQ